MTRAADIVALSDHGTTEIYDMTPTPLTTAVASAWQRTTGKRPGFIDIYLDSGTADFVIECSNNANDVNGTTVYSATIAGTDAKDGFTPYNGAPFHRIRRTNAGGNLYASLAYA
jgi:hypothetical protein